MQKGRFLALLLLDLSTCIEVSGVMKANYLFWHVGVVNGKLAVPR